MEVINCLPKLFPFDSEVHEPLFMREFRKTDHVSLAKSINDSHIADRVSNVPHPYTVVDALQWLQYLEKEHVRHAYTRRIDYAIVSEDEVIGSVAFIVIKGHKAQISWWLAEAYRGKGIVTRAAQELIKFGFENGLVRIEARPAVDNERSRKLLERLRFRVEGVHPKEWVDRNGVFHDSVSYGLVR